VSFTPSLDLSRMLFEEQIQPILAEKFPHVPYAAATSGMCSEILGLDDEISMDHEWGPRVTLFLSEESQVRHSAEMMAALKELLPLKFKGLDMMWRQAGVDVHNTRRTKLYHVYTSTVAGALGFAGGLQVLPLPDLEWLKISEQHLLEFTAGVIYKDDLGDLTRARESLRYYPDTVLRFLLMKEWESVGGDWFPIGRIGSREDRLGLRMQAAKVTEHLMRVAFMVSRRYCTYKKWFGTLFKTLPIAAELEPVLNDLLAEPSWQKVEEKIGEAASILMREQNQLGIAPKMALPAKRVDDGRHHNQYDFWRISSNLAKTLRPPLNALSADEVWWLHEKRLILFNGEVGKWSLMLQK
jgi:hypothetical protein